MPQSALLRDVDAQAEPQAAQPQAFELRLLPVRWAPRSLAWTCRAN